MISGRVPSVIANIGVLLYGVSDCLAVVVDSYNRFEIRLLPEYVDLIVT